MIEQTALVVKKENDLVWVEVERQSACGQCSVNKGCGTGVLSRVTGKKITNIRAVNPVNADVGDKVVVGLSEAGLLKSAVITYLFPILLMLAGAVVARLFVARLPAVNEELVIILGAIAGFMVSLWILRIFARNIANNALYQPVVLRKLHAPSVDMNIMVNQVKESF